MSGRPSVAGWTQTGSSHAARGRETQDAFLARSVPEQDVLVLAVADGVGSRDRSALGSRLAVDVACRILARDAPDPAGPAAVWRDWARAAATAVADEFRRCVRALGPDEDGRELATALAAAVVRGPWAGFVAVGDCFAAVRTTAPGADSGGGTWHLVLPPGNPAALPTAARSEIRAFALWDPELSGILLATDGCAPLALERPDGLGLPDAAGPQPAPAFFAEVARGIRDGGGSAALADLLRAGSAERSADDLTVLCALTAGP
ncbi:protein phosphatase 2C domain-containing protein [Catenulispora subtropica]|uniref:PPM-type phosphatase domain-containing protein n=1 Tax=Catenulispora subtropica TaxID=450798 RepID=A0ABP5CEA5_9ACTN